MPNVNASAARAVSAHMAGPRGPFLRSSFIGCGWDVEHDEAAEAIAVAAGVSHEEAARALRVRLDEEAEHAIPGGKP